MPVVASCKVNLNHCQRTPERYLSCDKSIDKTNSTEIIHINIDNRSGILSLRFTDCMRLKYKKIVPLFRDISNNTAQSVLLFGAIILIIVFTFELTFNQTTASFHALGNRLFFVYLILFFIFGFIVTHVLNHKNKSILTLQKSNQNLGAVIQQLRALNQELTENELKLYTRNQAILSAVTDIIMEVDNQKVYTWANKAGYDFFGDDVIGKEAAYYFIGEQKTYDKVQPLFNGNENIFYVESWQRRTDGQHRLLAWWCRVLKDKQGTVIGALSSGRDITEQKQMQDRLNQAEKMEAVGQLAGGIAHDFNNQLTGIMGFADILKEKHQDKSEDCKYIQMILNSAKRCSDLTSQLLAFARKGKYLSIPIDIHKIIRELLVLLEHSIGKNIQLTHDFTAYKSTILGDPTQIQNAFLNLAINSRDAMPDGGTLTFHTEMVFLDQEYCKTLPYEIIHGNYLKISVSDTGVGIDHETMKHLFEPFFTTKERDKGTGLGLAAVYGTVKSHKGAISVYSELKIGTTFSIFLPVYDADVVINHEHRDIPSPVKAGFNARIMVVDDEEVILNLITDMLRSLGFEVIPFSNSKAAVKFYAKEWNSINLVLLDMIMPEVSGYEAFHAMKKINPDICALLSSGYIIDGKAKGILDGDSVFFIQKPYLKVELSRKIAEALKLNSYWTKSHSL